MRVFFGNGSSWFSCETNGINLLLSRKKRLGQTIKLIIGAREIIEPLEISSAFNEYLTEIGPSLVGPKIKFLESVSMIP